MKYSGYNFLFRRKYNKFHKLLRHYYNFQTKVNNPRWQLELQSVFEQIYLHFQIHLYFPGKKLLCWYNSMLTQKRFRHVFNLFLILLFSYSLCYIIKHFPWWYLRGFRENSSFFQISTSVSITLQEHEKHHFLHILHWITF
jgi:hypothetical protein